MAKLQKFLFDSDFGAPPRTVAEMQLMEAMEGYGLDAEPMVEEEPPPPPPPTFSEEELMLAREQAFEQGRATGLQEAESFTERLLSLALQGMADGLQAVMAAQAAANEQYLKDAIVVAVTVVRRLFPEMVRHHGVDELEALLQECLGQIDHDLRVTVRVNPELLALVQERAEQVAQSVAFEGKLVYAGDPRLGVGDCRVEWGDGGAERDLERSWTEIEAVLARALGLEEPQPSGEPA